MTELPWTIWPLVYFRVDYPKEILEDFDLDIKLVKAAEPDTSNILDYILATDLAFAEEVCKNTEWLLVVNLKGKIEDSPSKRLATTLRTCK